MSSRAKFFKLFSSIVSLIATFGILWLLSQKIQTFVAGDHSPLNILYIALLAISLFILPFIFFPKAVRRKRTHPDRSSTEINATKLDLKIRKVMELTGDYSPNII